jgi:hypothetical protein
MKKRGRRDNRRRKKTVAQRKEARERCIVTAWVLRDEPAKPRPNPDQLEFQF